MRIKNKGAALVELVIIIPILALLFMGIIDFGLVLRDSQVTQNAVREGARISMLPQHQILRRGVNGNPQAAAVRAAEANVLRDVVIQYMAQENIAIPAVDCTDANGYAVLYECGDITIDQAHMLDANGITIGASKISLSFQRPALFKFYGPFTLAGSAVFRNLY